VAVMSEWRETTIGDVITLQRGFDIRQLDQNPGSIPVISSSGTTSYHDEYKAEEPGVLVGRKGTLGTVFYVEGNYWPHSTSLWVKDFKGNNPLFIYYFLHTFDLKAHDVGSSNPTLNRNHVHLFKCSITPLTTQRAIAEVLSSLDDKIDLLNRQNATLEALAQTYFRQWFVEGASEDWEECLLEDFVTVRYGKDHKHLGDGLIPVYGSGGIMRYADTAIYEKESVLIPRKGTLSNVIYLNRPFWSVDTMFFTEMKYPNTAKYVYFFMKSQDLVFMNVGSAVPSMTTDVLNNLPLTKPPSELLAVFEKRIAKPIFNKIEKNNTQIQTLQKLRDTLLPKLISGEVRLKTKAI
jgi:type I restriction enzyme S subunit